MVAAPVQRHVESEGQEPHGADSTRDPSRRGKFPIDFAPDAPSLHPHRLLDSSECEEGDHRSWWRRTVRACFHPHCGADLAPCLQTDLAMMAVTTCAARWTTSGAGSDAHAG